MISRLLAHEWELLKTLRLASLKDEPDAFSPTWQDTAALGDDRWRAGAERFGVPAVAMFILRPDRGLMSATCDIDGVGHIGAMWVQPSARDSGHGSALLDTGLDFLANCGCEMIELSVTETNVHALRLYESRGFELIGVDEPLRDGSPLRNLFMRWQTASGSQQSTPQC